MSQDVTNKKNPLTLSEIRDILRADVVVGHEMLDLEIEWGAGSDLMSDLLRGPTQGAVLLTGRYGREAGIETPVNDTLYGLVSCLDVSGIR